MSVLVPILFAIATSCAVAGRSLAAGAPLDVRLRAVGAVILAAAVVAVSSAAVHPLVVPAVPSLTALVLALAASLAWRIPDRMQSWATEAGELAMLLAVVVSAAWGRSSNDISLSPAICAAWALVGALVGRSKTGAASQRAVGPVLALGVIAASGGLYAVGPELGATVGALTVTLALALERRPDVRALGRAWFAAALGSGVGLAAAWVSGLAWDARLLLPVLATALLAAALLREPAAAPAAAPAEPEGAFDAERETLAVIGRLADPLASAERALLTLEHVFPGARIELLRVAEAPGQPTGARIDPELLAAVLRAGVVHGGSSHPSLSPRAALALRRLGAHVTLLPVGYRDRIHGVLLVRDLQLRDGSLTQARRFADLLGHRLEAQRLAAELQHKQRLATLGTFAAALLHDLRSPLATARLDMQLLQRSTPPAQHASFADAIGALDRVLEDLSGTLDFTRPLELEVATIDLAELVRAATASLRTRAERQEVELVTSIPTDGPVTVRGDRQRIMRALENIVRNALDVSTAGSTISVTLLVGPERVTLSVTDQGPGIDPELGERIFEPFVTSKREGVGLGLAIVRKIIEAHQGQVTADRLTAGGTRMTVWLPRAHATSRG